LRVVGRRIFSAPPRVSADSAIREHRIADALTCSSRIGAFSEDEVGNTFDSSNIARLRSQFRCLFCSVREFTILPESMVVE
jgi:hypothetical protein